MDCAWTLLVKSLDHYVYVAINCKQIKKKSCGQQIRLFDTGCLHVWMSANVSMWRGIVAKDSIILIKVWIKKKKRNRFLLGSLQPSITIPQVAPQRLDLITTATLLRCPLAPSVQWMCAPAQTCTCTHTKCSTSDRQAKAGQGTFSHLDIPLSTRTVKHLKHQSSVAIRDTLWLQVARWLWTWLQRAVHLSKP